MSLLSKFIRAGERTDMPVGEFMSSISLGRTALFHGYVQQRDELYSDRGLADQRWEYVPVSCS